jgi:hypothetical protein
MSSPVNVSLPRPVPDGRMRGDKRFLLCSLGSLLPILIRLQQQTHVVETVEHIHLSGVIDQIVPALISILAGGLMAFVFRDEINVYKLVVIGASAPALIATWSGYNLAQSSADTLAHIQALQTSNAPEGSSLPQPEARLSFPMDACIPVVYAAQSASASDIKPFPHYDPGTLARLSASVSGSLPTSHDYFVILFASSSADDAQSESKKVAGSVGGQQVDVFRSPDGYSPVLYCVVVSPNQTFDQASALQKQIHAAFPSSYIWTFGLALHPLAAPK